jgi:hypothetical protein
MYALDLYHGTTLFDVARYRIANDQCVHHTDFVRYNRRINADDGVLCNRWVFCNRTF